MTISGIEPATLRLVTLEIYGFLTVVVVMPKTGLLKKMLFLFLSTCEYGNELSGSIKCGELLD
jgi:hypothetical protein